MNNVELFVAGWPALLRIVMVGTVTFIGLVLLLRLTGNRTLSRLTTFDFIVTVAVGAVFGRALTAKDVSVAEALLAIVLLIVLQYVFSWLKMQSRTMERMFSAEPVVLYMDGDVREVAMRRERLTVNDLMSAVRTHGFRSLDEVDAVILEATGRISVFAKRSSS